MVRVLHLCALVLLASTPLPVIAAPLEVRELRTKDPIVQDAMPMRLGAAGRHLLVVTRPAPKQIDVQLFPPGPDGVPASPGRRIALPADVVAFDVARTDPSGLEALFFLTPSRVLRYEPTDGSLREVARATSIYRRPLPGRLLEVDFMRDREGAAPVLMLPDFDGMRVGATTLPVAARAQHREGSTIYRPVPVHHADVDFDGTDDVFVIDDDTLRYFRGSASGVGTTPRARPLGLDVKSERAVERLGDRDQSDVTTRRVIAIDDFDGDGRVDLLVESSRRSGILENETKHELHLGQPGPEGLTYATTPTTRIAGDAPLGGVRTADIDGDGRLDLAAGSIDVGLGTIVSALLTGTVDFDVRFFRLDEDGYSNEPNAVREARIEFDLSEGSASIPVLVLADVDGDGDRDLIVREDQNELLIYPADGSEELFADDAASMTVPLPRDGQLVQRAQLNDDDADDLVVRYEAISGPEAQRTLRLLLGVPAARDVDPAGSTAPTSD